MSLVFMDGFDHYAPVDTLKKWSFATNWTPTNDFSMLSRPGPEWARPPGGQGLRLVNNHILTKTLGVNLTTFVVGFNIYFDTFGTGALMALLDAGTEQLSLRLTAGGLLTVTRGGTVLVTSTNVLSQDTWYHFEFKATINNSTGVIECRVNGSSTGWIPSMGSLDTQVSANAYINQLQLGGSNSPLQFLDDVYLLDSTSPNNDFVGPQKIVTLYPAGAGNYAQWSPNYASNFANVEETTADGDTTFNQSSTASQIDSFAFEDPPSGTITAVQHCLTARQDAGTQRTIAAFQRSGTTDYVGASFNLAGTHLVYADPQDTNPDTSAAWTAAGIAAAEFGYKLTA